MGVSPDTPGVRLAAGAVAFVLLALWVRGWGAGRPEAGGATATDPLVIEAPSLRVVSGGDTVVVHGPTLFVPAGTPVEEAEYTEGVVAAMEALAEVVREATPGLEEMRVRIVTVEEEPHPLGAGAGGSDPAPPGGRGQVAALLLADGRGRLRRLQGPLTARAVVCAAAETFGIRPPAAMERSCG